MNTLKGDVYLDGKKVGEGLPVAVLEIGAKGKERHMVRDRGMHEIKVAIPNTGKLLFVRTSLTDELPAQMTLNLDGETYQEIHEVVGDAMRADDPHVKHLALIATMAVADAERIFRDELVEYINRSKPDN